MPAAAKQLTRSPGDVDAQDQFEATLARLGRPVYRDESCAIFNGDSLELLEAVPRGAIDLCVTSPPYNIGKAYEAVMSAEAYVEWSRTWLEKVHSVVADDGAFWLNLGYMPVAGRAKAMPLPYLLWEAVPFYLIQEIVWNYGAGVAARHSFSPRNEKFLWYVKDPDNYTFNLDEVRDPDVKYPNQMKNGKLRCNPLGKNPSDVWALPKVTSGAGRSSKERTPHPAQFPLAVIQRIIRATSNRGQLLLDPFLGSGSLIEAAIADGRFAIGIEIRSDYATLSADRIKAFRRQIPLI